MKKGSRSNSVVEEKIEKTTTSSPSPDVPCPNDAVKSEPRDESPTQEPKIEENDADEKNSVNLLCPRVEIVDIKNQLQNDGFLRCDNGVPIKMSDTKMECDEESGHDVPQTDPEKQNDDD